MIDSNRLRRHWRAQRSSGSLVTDRQINWLVYELYGLTDEEIRIVEEAMTCPHFLYQGLREYRWGKTAVLLECDPSPNGSGTASLSQVFELVGVVERDRIP